MIEKKPIKRALISVFDKSGLEDILHALHEGGVTFVSTGGTHDAIVKLGYPCELVEDLTGYPSILGGRVKTLHPKVFGGILARRDHEEDQHQIQEYEIPEIDLVIVDLYPFEKTVASGASHEQIIEKIDIGGISLIRAAAKNYKDVVIVAAQRYYKPFLELIQENGCKTTLTERTWFAKEAFAVSSGYDSAIFNYFDDDKRSAYRRSFDGVKILRYGENPHQRGAFFGDFDRMFEKLQGKEISYNNLLDIDAAINLIDEFDDTTFAILKHTNPCGLASRPSLVDAWRCALAGDPVSAFGGILVTNAVVDRATAEEINKLFFEVIIAEDYDTGALELLMQKKNRIILVRKEGRQLLSYQERSVLNGVLVQDKDLQMEQKEGGEIVTKRQPTDAQIDDLKFANKIVKHCKSNAIVLAKNRQLCASGVGQTSRVDALKQAIEKAQSFNFDLNHAVMASDAFFPFPDCVEIAHNAGVDAVIQPGGSIKDGDSIEYCDDHDITMIFTGMRHFKH